MLVSKSAFILPLPLGPTLFLILQRVHFSASPGAKSRVGAQGGAPGRLANRQTLPKKPDKVQNLLLFLRRQVQNLMLNLL
jgi:hypothetical protein